MDRCEVMFLGMCSSVVRLYSLALRWCSYSSAVRWCSLDGHAVVFLGHVVIFIRCEVVFLVCVPW